MAHFVLRKDKLIVCEGLDDKDICEKLINILNLDNIQVEQTHGKDKTSEFLETSKDIEDAKSIAVIRDADDDPRGAFNSVCSALKNANLPVPNAHFMKRRTKGSPDVSVFIVPDGLNNMGEMETLFVKSIIDKPIYLKCIKEFVECAGKNGFKGSRRTEAYAYISVLKKQHRFGESVKNDGWGDLSHPCFDDLKKFLRQI